jgi:hypothetical protein
LSYTSPPYEHKFDTTIHGSIMFVYWTLVQYGKNWDFKQKSEYQSRESGVEGKVRSPWRTLRLCATEREILPMVKNPRE